MNKKINVFVGSRLGSTRVPHKNLRLICNKPLFQYQIDELLSNSFPYNLYLNSDSDIILDVAKKKYREKIFYYKRPPAIGTSKATLDDVAYDFMSRIEGELTIFLNPCALFLKNKTLLDAIDFTLSNNLDSCVASKSVQTHCFIYNNPVNFKFNTKQPRTQDLAPVHAATCAFFIWKNKTFLKSYKKKGYANFCGKFHSYELSNLESIDIDTEEDFKIAESLINSKSFLSRKKKPIYHRVISRLIKENLIKTN